MSTNENPAPRANAGNRANSKVEQTHASASAVDWEADAVAIWFARHFPMMPATLARVLAALASLGRAFQ
jgi:hypothetical protein